VKRFEVSLGRGKAVQVKPLGASIFGFAMPQIICRRQYHLTDLQSGCES
jgi:hypothetical protein